MAMSGVRFARPGPHSTHDVVASWCGCTRSWRVVVVRPTDDGPIARIVGGPCVCTPRERTVVPATVVAVTVHVYWVPGVRPVTARTSFCAVFVAVTGKSAWPASAPPAVFHAIRTVPARPSVDTQVCSVADVLVTSRSPPVIVGFVDALTGRESTAVAPAASHTVRRGW